MGDTVLYKGNLIDYDMVMSKYANQRMRCCCSDTSSPLRGVLRRGNPQDVKY